MAILKIRDILYKISNKKVISYQLKEKNQLTIIINAKQTKIIILFYNIVIKKILEIKNFTRSEEHTSELQSLL